MTRPLTITDRDLDTLFELEAANRREVGFRDGWARPMDCGGHNGSHHSKTLQKLAALGLVHMHRPRREASNSRPGIGYKINANGAARLAHERLKLEGKK